MKRLAIAIAAISSLFALPATAEPIRITSLDWPPYAGEALPQQGTSITLIRGLFAKANMELEVEFLPWERAIRKAMEGEGFVGYGPEYYDTALDTEKGGDRCLFSKPYQSGPLGLVVRSSAPMQWSGVADLAGKVIGTVSGYVNTAEFDAMAAAGAIKVESVADDATNIRKVAAGRVPAAVIDANVLAYLLENDPALSGLAGQVQFSPTLLEDKSLYICFRPDEAGQKARAAFNAQIP